MNRRKFIKDSILGGAAVVAISQYPFSLLADNKETRLTILNTNDTHSRLEAFPMDGGKYQGLGGVAARAGMIHEIRQKEKNVLLFDSGDIFQGTPYFNFFHGEPELKAMSEMKYDAATIGNHEFDAGIEQLADNMKYANFDFIISNYDFSKTVMKNKTISHKVYDFDHVRIGVYGLGIELDGLVPGKLTGQTRYLDPVKIAGEQEKFLKEEAHCDFIVCLSHLGYKYEEKDKISDHTIAKNTDMTDLILGGHTHTFLDESVVVNNRQNKACHVFQVGWGGVNLGRVDLVFSKSKKLGNIKSSYLKIN